jgi:hypothetical protein
VSFVVHAFPSLQGDVLSVWTQPAGPPSATGLQESSVQGLLSLQLGAVPPLQVPPPHVSFVVHAFPSLHGDVLLVWTQPAGMPKATGLQESFVHGLLSSQLSGAPPLQVPPPHVSFVVHAFPSLHAAVLLAWTQPVAGSQESFVHGLLSSQLSGAPPLQVPPPHVSFAVHAFPSSQGDVLSVWTQPVAGSQESSVQGLLSLQSRGAPETQLPPEHCAWPVHVVALPQTAPSCVGSWWQTATPLSTAQLSAVQTLSSSQSAVTQGSRTVVKSRSVQSHFDPVPACERLVHATEWFAFCSQTRQEGTLRWKLASTEAQETMAVTVQ